MMYFLNCQNQNENKDGHKEGNEFCSSKYVETIGKISEYSRFGIAFATLLPEESKENKFFFF